MPLDYKRAHKSEDVPEHPHFAIIEFSSVHVPGDERSRQAPGHGYPAHSVSKCDYLVFESEEEWKANIDERMRRTYDRGNFVAIRATRAKVSTTVNVDIE